MRDVADAVRRLPFPVYALPPGWECDRTLRGTSGNPKTGLSGVLFSHAIGGGRRPIAVEVGTTRGWPGGVSESKEHMEFELGLRGADDDQPLGELEWMRMRIPVDGVSTEFEVIAGRGNGWGAVGAVDDVVVSVQVANFAMADVVLERVADVEPYLAETPPAR